MLVCLFYHGQVGGCFPLWIDGPLGKVQCINTEEIGLSEPIFPPGLGLVSLLLTQENSCGVPAYQWGEYGGYLVGALKVGEGGTPAHGSFPVTVNCLPSWYMLLRANRKKWKQVKREPASPGSSTNWHVAVKTDAVWKVLREIWCGFPCPAQGESPGEKAARAPDPTPVCLTNVRAANGS